VKFLHAAVGVQQRFPVRVDAARGKIGISLSYFKSIWANILK
jgi:hypothetical protein